MPQDLYPLSKPLDGPIFGKNNGAFLGYYFAFPTNYRYLLIYDELKPLFKNLGAMKDLADQEGMFLFLI